MAAAKPGTGCPGWTQQLSSPIPSEMAEGAGKGLGQDRSVSGRSQLCSTALTLPLICLFSWNRAMNEVVGLAWHTMVPACVCLNIDVSQMNGFLIIES